MLVNPDSPQINIEMYEDLLFILTQEARYKILYGGRGALKSHTFARAAIIQSLDSKKRILCTRDYQNSIADSVHKLLEDLIWHYKLQNYFDVTKTGITNYLGSEFIFKGLERSIREIKSLEAIDICWIEEAAKTSAKSWDILIPTIRKEKSEIWASFNPDENKDYTYQNFIVKKKQDSIVKKTYYYDNPWLTEPLRKEAQDDKINNLERYNHVWLGNCKKRNDAQIFKGKWEVKEFDTPNVMDVDNTRFFYGADWGFATDPTTLVRLFIKDNCLHIEYEAYGVGVDMNELSQLFNNVPEARKWTIKADCARPETISYLAQEYDPKTDEKGFKIVAADKWKGSVEDGIEYIKGFNKIYIHPRCVHAVEEFQYYSFKVDKNTKEILPVIVDKYNHIIDAIRYALSDYIKKHEDPEYNEEDNINAVAEDSEW
jgi:phage terminase large subunit